MSSRLRLILACFIFGVTFGVSFIGCTWDSWWYQIDDFQESGSRWKVTVYKSTQGNILFIGTNDSGVMGFIFDPVQQRVGEQPYSKMYRLPYAVFNKETPLPVEWNNRDYNLVVEGAHMEFTGFLGFRFQLDLNNY